MRDLLGGCRSERFAGGVDAVLLAIEADEAITLAISGHRAVRALAPRIAESGSQPTLRQTVLPGVRRASLYVAIPVRRNCELLSASCSPQQIHLNASVG